MSLRNRKIIGWKIWYGDKSTVSSKDSKWIDAPQKNVQVVKIFYKSDNGIETNTFANQEYYILDDLLNLPPEIKTAKGIDGNLFFTILSDAKFDEEIVSEMQDD
jgi:hypothetical protein